MIDDLGFPLPLVYLIDPEERKLQDKSLIRLSTQNSNYPDEGYVYVLRCAGRQNPPEEFFKPPMLVILNDLMRQPSERDIVSELRILKSKIKEDALLFLNTAQSLNRNAFIKDRSIDGLVLLDSNQLLRSDGSSRSNEDPLQILLDAAYEEVFIPRLMRWRENSAHKLDGKILYAQSRYIYDEIWPKGMDLIFYFARNSRDYKYHAALHVPGPNIAIPLCYHTFQKSPQYLENEPAGQKACKSCLFSAKFISQEHSANEAIASNLNSVLLVSWLAKIGFEVPLETYNRSRRAFIAIKSGTIPHLEAQMQAKAYFPAFLNLLMPNPYLSQK